MTICTLNVSAETWLRVVVVSGQVFKFDNYRTDEAELKIKLQAHARRKVNQFLSQQTPEAQSFTQSYDSKTKICSRDVSIYSHLFLIFFNSFLLLRGLVYSERLCELKKYAKSCYSNAQTCSFCWISSSFCVFFLFFRALSFSLFFCFFFSSLCSFCCVAAGGGFPKFSSLSIANAIYLSMMFSSSYKILNFVISFLLSSAAFLKQNIPIFFRLSSCSSSLFVCILNRGFLNNRVIQNEI